MLSWFVDTAHAMGAPAQGGEQANPTMSIMPLVLMFVIFYFLLIRPQQKRAKEHSAMVAALAKGDEVVTNGGLLGKITQVGDNFVTLEVNEGTAVKVQRAAVAALMPKGTIKDA